MNSLSPAALALILEFEGIDQPSRWPGESSGITLGHGFDIGMQSEAEFRAAWSPHLKPDQMARLSRAVGVTGRRAAGLASNFRDIRITSEMAAEVFTRCSVPRILSMVQQAFPGVDRLPANAAGALASLVYNRGTSMTGSRRTEMVQIRTAVADHAAGRVPAANTLRAIAKYIRAMKRLWDIHTMRGLHRRRDAEAALIERAAASLPAAA